MANAPDDAALLDLVGEVIGLLDLEELMNTMLDALGRAVPATWVSLNEVGPERVTALVRGEKLDQHYYDVFAELAHENPLVQRWNRTRDGRAYRWSDVATRAELTSTRLWREFYGQVGANHQMAFALPSESDRVLALVLTRRRGDFTDAERDFVNRARPFLIQAYRNALAYAAATERGPVRALSEAGLTEREAQVVALVARGLSNRGIAAELGVSDRTVQKHLERAYRKLGVRTRSEAATRAWELAAPTSSFSSRP